MIWVLVISFLKIKVRREMQSKIKKRNALHSQYRTLVSLYFKVMWNPHYTQQGGHTCYLPAFPSFSLTNLWKIISERLINRAAFWSIFIWLLRPKFVFTCWITLHRVLLFRKRDKTGKVTDQEHVLRSIGGARSLPPSRFQMLSFQHTKFSKRNCLGSREPPTRSMPPTGNPGSTTA